MSDPDPRPYVLEENAGTAISFLGALMVRKAGARETNGRFDLLDQRVPPGYAPPRHRHESDDEAWYLLDGDATFWCGAERFVAGSGSFVYLPRGIEHAFLVGDRGARLLTLTAPSGFAGFVDEVGRPAATLVIQESEPMDEHRLAEIAARYGIVITGPPPR